MLHSSMSRLELLGRIVDQFLLYDRELTLENWLSYCFHWDSF
jgi:hypothetical protein